MNASSRPKCQVAQLTAPGRGAIATVALWGPDATALLEKTFRPARTLTVANIRSGSILFGRWASDADVSEEVVVCRQSSDTWEVHCHGGRVAPEAIVHSLQRRGAERVAWSDWLRPLAADRLAAQARIALASARTLRAAAVLLDQYRGALRGCLQAICGALAAGRLELARRQLLDLQRWADVGNHLQHPWRLVVAGRPNVGKSSLVNALLGFERAIVYDQPGTTRDVLRWNTALDGWPVELIDTAGLRSTADVIESAGVARAQKQIREADLVLLVFDVSVGWTEEDECYAAEIPNALLVGNKCDLLNAEWSDAAGALLTSATKQAGLQSLSRAAVAQLIPSPPASGEAVPFLPEHFEAIRSALAAIDQNDDSAALESLMGLL